MKPIFADSSYFIALVDSHDSSHNAAVDFSGRNTRPLLVTGAIVLELGAHFCQMSRRAAFLRLIQLLEEDRVEIVQVDLQLQNRGVERFAKRPDKNWSLADCISMLVMEDRGLHEAATFDEHFEQAGFTTLLRANPAS